MKAEQYKLRLRQEYGMVWWEVDKTCDDTSLLHAVPIVYTRTTKWFCGDEITKNFYYGFTLIRTGDMHDIITLLTKTESFDWAVPVFPGGKYPHGGDAITVYKSEKLETGIVRLQDVHNALSRIVADLIHERMEW